MPGPFDKEIESLAESHTHAFAQKLAHEVNAYIRRKLGVGQEGSTSRSPAATSKATTPSRASAKPAAKPAKAAAASKKPAGTPAPVKAPAATKKPAGTPAAATNKPVAAPAAKPARRRSSGSDMATVTAKVLQLVTASNGAGASDVIKSSGLQAAPVSAALKALRAEGRIYMGGNRRFARYATSQAAADRASQAVRKG